MHRQVVWSESGFLDDARRHADAISSSSRQGTMKSGQSGRQSVFCAPDAAIDGLTNAQQRANCSRGLEHDVHEFTGASPCSTRSAITRNASAFIFATASSRSSP